MANIKIEDIKNESYITELTEDAAELNIQGGPGVALALEKAVALLTPLGEIGAAVAGAIAVEIIP